MVRNSHIGLLLLTIISLKLTLKLLRQISAMILSYFLTILLPVFSMLLYRFCVAKALPNARAPENEQHSNEPRSLQKKPAPVDV